LSAQSQSAARLQPQLGTVIIIGTPIITVITPTTDISTTVISTPIIPTIIITIIIGTAGTAGISVGGPHEQQSRRLRSPTALPSP
jgi:hypothetical protein